MQRTKAIEILSEAGVPFEVREFPATEFTAREAAVKLSIPEENVFKTLVTRADDGTLFMAVVQGDLELDLKKLAREAGKKRAELVDVRELQKLTGYLKGGVSPLGGRKEMKLFLDCRALEKEFISISAGLRGVQILLSPRDFIAAARPVVADISA